MGNSGGRALEACTCAAALAVPKYELLTKQRRQLADAVVW